MHLTHSTALTLFAIAKGYSYGFEIMEATGLASGTVYPILRRLARLRYIEARWEDERVATREGRPRRRYYVITPRSRDALLRARTRFGYLEALVQTT